MSILSCEINLADFSACKVEIPKISFKCINSTKVKSVKINLCEFILLSKYFVIIKIIWFLYK